MSQFEREGQIYLGREVEPDSEKKEYTIEPSYDAAWFLGVLSTAGYTRIQGKRYAVRLQTQDSELIEKFSALGEQILETKPILYTNEYSDPNRKMSQTVQFSGKKAVTQTGDMRKSIWPATIARNHSWIMEDDIYLWKFIEGMFDASGHIGIAESSKGVRGYLRINCPTQEGLVFINSLLQRLEFRNSQVYLNPKGRVGYIRNYSQEEVVNFSLSINSCITQKQESLEIMRKKGVEIARRKEKSERIEEPSTNLAWTLGVLSAAGHVDPSGGSIGIVNKHEELLKKFLTVGQELFGTTGYRFRLQGKHPAIKFSDTASARIIGDLRFTNWVARVKEKYPWLIDKEYIWDFLRGFFDARGYVSDFNESAASNLLLTHPDKKGCNFLQDILFGLDFSNPIVVKNKTYKQGVRGVLLARNEDIKKFAQSLHSCIPEKEERLEKFRHIIYKESEDHKRIVEAYDKVFEVRRLTGLGLYEISKLPEIASYEIPIATLRKWLFYDANPRNTRRKGFKWTNPIDIKKPDDI
ncbi:hypothetical protein A2803_04710 [Candidatus Woesebacteria bacterium RIFCSPHIGHO2_01_FULL_44_21]|uniref:Homing endonuclease LAGLIDADG domain-containing protein n=1 Tax=Candidatus Woesebacteria bacterium RIFCSPHIGHO2_01_FULL_44_21 TaxID=1802503 RepID=A0A1F7Z3F4_9BACT|nr:MAG: hypothetical protein A2803_04710 [Candidatus Woesebacteria bacterium RIFCSPHIGHO2_01_FULL_44_21]OGM69419.1 MAG: hypothetical protein A2897_03640 [Candidatus Woesebacteria bacterium RIFCSPLOWO2_01_FULL_44_24b]